MTYLAEFRLNWRALTSATLGLGAGGALNSYSGSLFAPALIAEFGWSKAEFSLVGTATLLSLVVMPFVGRFADRRGVRLTALIGVIGVSACFFALSLMSGNFLEYFAISALQMMLGATTTSAVYSRLIAERFDRAKGMAFALAISGPAFIAAVGTPLLGQLIETEGWRAGFRALGAFAAVGGAIALSLVPRSRHRPSSGASRSNEGMAAVYRAIFRRRAFWIIIAAMVLCNLPQSLSFYHLKLLMADKGVAAATATWIVSLYATGIMVGRFLCGAALDRWPAHIVCAVAMSLPAAGLLIFASPIGTPALLAVAVLLMGLSQGAEGDLAAYLVIDNFGIEVYSSVLGPVIAAISSAGALGAGLLSLALALTGNYTIFLYLTGSMVLVGSALFLFLGTNRTHPVLQAS